MLGMVASLVAGTALAQTLRIGLSSDVTTIDPQWKEANIFPIIPESALRATLGILERTLKHSDRW